LQIRLIIGGRKRSVKLTISPIFPMVRTSTTKQAAKKAAARLTPGIEKVDGESAVFAKIAIAAKELNAAYEARIGALVKKAVS